MLCCIKYERSCIRLCIGGCQVRAVVAASTSDIYVENSVCKDNRPKQYVLIEYDYLFENVGMGQDSN